MHYTDRLCKRSEAPDAVCRGAPGGRLWPAPHRPVRNEKPHESPQLAAECL